MQPCRFARFAVSVRWLFLITLLAIVCHSQTLAAAKVITDKGGEVRLGSVSVSERVSRLRNVWRPQKPPGTLLLK